MTETALTRRGLLLSALGLGAAALLPGAAGAAATSGIVPPPATDAITPFLLRTPQADIDDLKRRLAATRLPERETAAGQGVPLDQMQALLAYWRDGYDWRRFERKLNGLPQFRTRIDGVGIHFIHVRSPHKNALPLLLTHGWPGSMVEFLDVVGPLTDPVAYGGKPEDAFDVVIPSMPGFGLSDKPAEAGWNVVRIAKAWTVLMQRLGYQRWVAQGGDWGAGVTTALGHLRPAGLAGIHLNWQFVFPEKVPTEGLSADEQRAVAGADSFLGDGGGYFKLQTTRPQTIGYALADSPAGQAAWIYEKLLAWSDNDGRAESAISRDAMLDNITLYWLTNSAASSARIYWENKGASFSGGKLDLPVAVSVFPREIYRAPKSWTEQTYSQLIYWNEVERGGHFAAFEQPQLFTREMRNGFRPLRK